MSKDFIHFFGTTGYSRNQVFAFQNYIDLFLK